MKRTGFKIKPRKPLKRSVLKKKSKQKISTIQNKIWELIKQIVRKRYPNTCYTCGQTGLTGSNCHVGHMWAKASLGAFLKYDLRVLRIQCYNCNINRGGMGADFYKKMLQEIGQVEMEKLEKDRLVLLDGWMGRPTAESHYLKLLAEYQKLVL